MTSVDATRSEPSLTAELRRLAALPSLLVAVDFDGTLSPLVDEPLAARPLPGSIEALGELAALPGTLVAIVSGRALATLATLSGAAAPLLLIGSHGVETSYAEVGPVTDEEERRTYAALDTDLLSLLERHPGARIERKPHSLVLHTRGMPAAAEVAALRAGHEVAARHPGLWVTPGKGVLELATQHVGKGSALRELAAAHAVDATIYLGDDVTDEHAFEALGRQDVGVKVGEGVTVARHRLHDESQVLALLRELLELRRASGPVSDDPEQHRSSGAG